MHASPVDQGSRSEAGPSPVLSDGLRALTERIRDNSGATRASIVLPSELEADSVRQADLRLPIGGQGGDCLGWLLLDGDGLDAQSAEGLLPAVQALLMLDRDLAQQQQREQAILAHNAELAKFASHAAHDLREPLRKLSMFSGLLLEDRKDPDAEETLCLTTIVDASQRMDVLVEELLNLAQAENEPFERETVELGDCLRSALQDLQLRVEESRAEITCAELPAVRGSRAWLTRLLRDLVDNSLKFRSEESPRVHVDCLQNGDERFVRVTDNGIGIPPEHAASVMHPFRRLHGKGTYSGPGLGLTLARRIVERHAGCLWVESMPKGCRVCFTLGQP